MTTISPTDGRRRPRRRATPQRPEAPRVLAYTRVSTAGQEASGAGLEAQRQAITDRCARQPSWAVEWLTETGTAKTLATRPVLSAALDRLDLGLADVLVVSKLDRLARSTVDFGHMLDRARTNGWKLICLDLDLDMTTAAGELMATVVAAVAQFEARRIGERTREGLAEKKLAGIIPGPKPSLSHYTLAAIVAEHRAGVTLATIAAHLNDRAVPRARGNPAPWNWQAVQSALKTSAALALQGAS